MGKRFSLTTAWRDATRRQAVNLAKTREFMSAINALRGAGGQCAEAGTWRSLSGFRTR